MATNSYFIQNLTMRAWWFSVWPRMICAQLSQKGSVADCFVIDSSKLALWVAKLTGLLAGVAVSRFVYSLVDARDEDGLQIRIKIEAEDLQEMQAAIIATPEFEDAFSRNTSDNRLRIYVAKMAVINDPFPQAVIWRALITLQICAWKSKRDAGESAGSTVFIENKIWTREILRYAQRLGLTAIPVSPAINVRSAIIGCIPPQFRSALRVIRYRMLRRRTQPTSNRNIGESTQETSRAEEAVKRADSHRTAQPMGPKVAVDYFGQLNLDRPELSSELFFWQQSCLNGGDVLLNLRFPFVPLSGQAWQQLNKNGISTVAMHPGATGGFDIPVFNPVRKTKPSPSPKNSKAHSSKNSRWISKQIDSYQNERSIWTDFFDRNNVKVYTTWYTNGPAHCAITDALESLGGVTATYQRSLESYPTAVTTAASDIAFDFSQFSAQIGRESGSRVKYRVITGFLGDHRFELLKGSEEETRNKLKANGARWIAAYFDENTVDDSRWFTGHQFTRENYAFLLEKVLTDFQFGLILKPRTPRGLRQRLGSVTQLLDAAIETGRCHIYESGNIRGKHTPAAAALASDIAIHGHLYAGSAGLESALAGVPTLLLDREGWHKSPLYKLGVGKSVFTDWESLWEAVENHRSNPAAHLGFGDWSPLLDELDPFRDGRAAERMGTYIHWMLQGFANGLDRETIMADAAERYCTEWGADKVSEPLTKAVLVAQNIHSQVN